MSDALDRALEEMRTSRRPGLVIVIPDDFPCAQLGELSNRLMGLFVDAAPRPSRAVVACARAGEARTRFSDAPTLLALDPDGRPMGSRTGELGDLLRAPAFWEAVDALFAAAPAAPRAAPALPYGVEWAEATHRNLFGTAYDPCPGCGLPSVDEKEAELIRYLRLME